jgi:Transposase DDE domain
MTENTTSGNGMIPKSAEESVPYYNWLSWLKSFAIKCVKKNHLPIFVGNTHTADDFWMVIIMHALMNLSIDEASDSLNQILWDEENSHRRHKVLPPLYQGRFKRRKRKCPNGDQTRKYRNSLPKWMVKDLNNYIFEQQIEYALEENLITNEIDILVDNTDVWYYGSDRYPDNPYITKGYNGPGTSRKRNFLGIMLKSGTTYLYCGVDIIKKKHSNVPFILETMDFLIEKGFKIRYLIGDRWFPTVELLSELPSREIDYIGPYKKYAPVKRKIENYIINGGKYIVSHMIGGVMIWLILTNRQGRRLRDIRLDYLKNRKSLTECVKEIMVMATTVKPPKGKKKQQGWAMQICRVYEHRWQIETGFRDLNRISPPSNARTNTRKLFMCSVRYWVYNAWQLERAKRRKLQRCPKSWKKGPTLRRFTDCAIKIGVYI